MTLTLPAATSPTKPTFSSRREPSTPGAIRTPQHASLPAPRGPILFDPILTVRADTLDDIEQARIALSNRIYILTSTRTDSDGVERGLGLDERSPEVARMLTALETLKAIEHDAELALCRRIRQSPFAEWIATSNGVGVKQAARLLASIGDPYWNTLHDRPRTVSELWAYCGYSVVGGSAQRRQRGQVSNWNPKARMRAFLVATSCMKVRAGTYRPYYDEARARHAEAIHAASCAQCGTKGRPAPEGSPLRPSHQHARGLRAVAKAVLKDIWLTARAEHERTA